MDTVLDSAYIRCQVVMILNVTSAIRVMLLVKKMTGHPMQNRIYKEKEQYIKGLGGWFVHN